MIPSDATKKSAALTACIMIQAKLDEVSGLHRAIEIAMGSQQKPVNLVYNMVLSSKGHKKGRFSSKKDDPAKLEPPLPRPLRCLVVFDLGLWGGEQAKANQKGSTKRVGGRGHIMHSLD